MSWKREIMSDYFKTIYFRLFVMKVTYKQTNSFATYFLDCKFSYLSILMTIFYAKI